MIKEEEKEIMRVSREYPIQPKVRDFIGQVKHNNVYGYRIHGYEYFKDGTKMSKMFALNHHNKIEVIGNIYQNPDLIK